MSEASVLATRSQRFVRQEAGDNIRTGTGNTLIGFEAGISTTGSGNVYIGAQVIGVAGENNTTRIANIYDSVATDRIVYVNAEGKLGTQQQQEEIKVLTAKLKKQASQIQRVSAQLDVNRLSSQ